MRCYEMQDMSVCGLLALGYFCGAIPLASHVGDWKFWKARGSMADVERHNINGIISSAAATSVSGGYLMTVSNANAAL